MNQLQKLHQEIEHKKMQLNEIAKRSDKELKVMLCMLYPSINEYNDSLLSKHSMTRRMIVDECTIYITISFHNQIEISLDGIFLVSEYDNVAKTKIGTLDRWYLLVKPK